MFDCDNIPLIPESLRVTYHKVNYGDDYHHLFNWYLDNQTNKKMCAAKHSCRIQSQYSDTLYSHQTSQLVFSISLIYSSQNDAWQTNEQSIFPSKNEMKRHFICATIMVLMMPFLSHALESKRIANPFYCHAFPPSLPVFFSDSFDQRSRGRKRTPKC